MYPILIFGGVYSIYGLVGVIFRAKLTIQERFKNKPWTKAYIRDESISECLIGGAWVAAYFCLANAGLKRQTEILILIAAALPGLILSFLVNAKYKKKLREEG